MNYTVRWLKTAESELMSLWIRAANRDAVAGYVEQIDRILQRTPSEQGESRDANERLWFHRPISVLYRVDETTRTVIVGRIKWVGR
jgi:hypothetical protein